MTVTTYPSVEHASGVSDLAYDLVAMLHNKLEAVAAMEIYKRDAKLAGQPHALEFLSQCQESDRDAIRQLRAMVSHQLVIGLEGIGNPAEVAMQSQQDEPENGGLVQSASEDSFPASDPPAYNIGRDHITRDDR